MLIQSGPCIWRRLNPFQGTTDMENAILLPTEEGVLDQQSDIRGQRLLKIGDQLRHVRTLLQGHAERRNAGRQVARGETGVVVVAR